MWHVLLTLLTTKKSAWLYLWEKNTFICIPIGRIVHTNKAEITSFYPIALASCFEINLSEFRVMFGFQSFWWKFRVMGDLLAFPTISICTTSETAHETPSGFKKGPSRCTWTCHLEILRSTVVYIMGPFGVHWCVHLVYIGVHYGVHWCSCLVCTWIWIANGKAEQWCHLEVVHIWAHLDKA